MTTSTRSLLSVLTFSSLAMSTVASGWFDSILSRFTDEVSSKYHDPTDPSNPFQPLEICGGVGTFDDHRGPGACGGNPITIEVCCAHVSQRCGSGVAWWGEGSDKCTRICLHSGAPTDKPLTSISELTYFRIVYTPRNKTAPVVLVFFNASSNSSTMQEAPVKVRAHTCARACVLVFY